MKYAGFSGKVVSCLLAALGLMAGAHAATGGIGTARPSASRSPTPTS